MTDSPRWPRQLTQTALILFAFFLPISHVPVQMAIVLAVVGFCAEGVLNKRWQMHWHPIFIPLIAYLFWNTISSLLSPRPQHSFFAMLDNEWPVMGMIILFWLVEDLRQLKNVVTAFLISAALAAVYGVWQSVTGIDFLRHREVTSIGFGFFRSTGFYGFYLTFAALAMAAFFISGARVLEEVSVRRKLGFVAVVAFLAIVGSFARSIWIAVAVVLPLLAFVKGKRFGSIVTIALVALVIIASLTLPAFYYRIVSIADLGQNQTRVNLWRSAVAMASDHPVLGVGEDNWDYFFEQYRVAGGYYDTKVHPHNDYLNVLVGSGVPGVIFFLSMWAIAIRTGLKTFRTNRRSSKGSIALGGAVSIAGLMIAAFFQNYYGTFINCFLWWFLVGIVLTAERVPVAEEET